VHVGLTRWPTLSGSNAARSVPADASAVLRHRACVPHAWAPLGPSSDAVHGEIELQLAASRTSALGKDMTTPSVSPIERKKQTNLPSIHGMSGACMRITATVSRVIPPFFFFFSTVCDTGTVQIL
jgi:hypothetical protein